MHSNLARIGFDWWRAICTQGSLNNMRPFKMFATFWLASDISADWLWFSDRAHTFPHVVIERCTIFSALETPLPLRGQANAMLNIQTIQYINVGETERRKKTAIMNEWPQLIKWICIMNNDSRYQQAFIWNHYFGLVLIIFDVRSIFRRDGIYFILFSTNNTSLFVSHFGSFVSHEHTHIRTVKSWLAFLMCVYFTRVFYFVLYFLNKYSVKVYFIWALYFVYLPLSSRLMICDFF